MAIAASQSGSLRALVRSITKSLARDDLSVSDMSHAAALEFDRTISPDQHDREPSATVIRRLEGPIRAREVPRHIGTSPIRYFLDGSQKTLPVWRVGTTPVIVSAIAVAILQRHGPAEIGLVPETLVAQLTWLLPRESNDPRLQGIVSLLEEMEQQIVDPLIGDELSDPETYQRFASDYLFMLERSYRAAKTERSRLEGEMVRLWERSISRSDQSGWLVVDGQLNTDTPHAVGLVKNARAQHFEGSEAATLYDLSPGERTGAYTLPDVGHREGAERAMWYLRMQDPTGLDARHGLIRLETPEILSAPDLVDPISSWILAERAPRASSDERWATLLYPIHLLERMLKRHIDALTAGWPH